MLKRMAAVIMGLGLAMALATSASAAEVSGIEVRDTLNVGGETLTLNGAGARSRFFVKLYVAALYLREPSTDAGAILEADEPQALALHVTSGRINSDNMLAQAQAASEAASGCAPPIPPRPAVRIHRPSRLPP